MLQISFNPSKPKPTILQVIPSLGTGGVEIETNIIAHAIVAAGGRALIACATPDKALRLPGIEYIDLPLRTKSPFQIARNISLLKDAIKKEGVDLVHARSRGPAWSAYKASRDLKIPFVTTYHAAYSSTSPIKTWYNSVMTKGERVIAISHFIKKHILQNYQERPWFKEGNVRLIERGVDLNVFDSDEISEDRLEKVRASWELPTGTRVLLLPGRISRNKGHQTAINALSMLKDRKIVLLFVGSDHKHEAYRQFLLEHAHSCGMGGRVKWQPPALDLPAVYKLADIVVCPSQKPEGFGRVVAEAQAMKKPVIVSAHGAAPEVMQDGITGWIFSPGDDYSLARVLERALALPAEALLKMGEKGRDRVKEKYDQRLMESKTLEVYKELLGN